LAFFDKLGMTASDMKLFFFVSLLFLSGFALAAPDQAPVPATPVDPNQSIPAQPVEKTPPAPVSPAVVPAPVVSLSILADSSLREVLRELAQTWADSQPNSPQVPLTLTNAAALRNQFQSNATFDVVIGADADDLKALTAQGLLAPDGQRALARNTVVIYGRKALVKDDELDWFDLIGTEWKKIALATPDLAESGRVARRALQKHDLYDDDHKKLFVSAPTENLALQVLERDQADAVFVYRTDLRGVNLPGFDLYPLDSTEAPPVFYVAAQGRLAKNPDGARAFIDFCGSEAARPIWAKYGFETN
jgi:molybdenum ABC transporter molybdate-binding protein